MIESLGVSFLSPNGTRMSEAALSAENIAVRVTERDGTPYLVVHIGEDVAAEIGIAEGDRVTFGVSASHRRLIVKKALYGWKVGRHGSTLTAQIVAKKLGLDIGSTAAHRADFITFDESVILSLDGLDVRNPTLTQ